MYAVQINRSRCHYIIPIRPSPSSFPPSILTPPPVPFSIINLTLHQPFILACLDYPPFSSQTNSNLYQNDWRQIRRQGQRWQDVAIVSFSLPFLLSIPSEEGEKKVRLFLSSEYSGTFCIISLPCSFIILTLFFSSRSSKAGLAFPVGRVHRLLRKGNYAQRVGAGESPQAVKIPLSFPSANFSRQVHPFI